MNLPIGYLIMNLPHGVPYTVDQAFAFVRDANIVFGFPDILLNLTILFLALSTI